MKTLQLKRTTEAETADAARCQARLQHLVDIGQPSKDTVLDWNRKRLPRILVDHLLRCGYTSTASLLVEVAHLQVLDPNVLSLRLHLNRSIQRRKKGV